MALQSLADFYTAFDNGQTHSQRVFKNAGPVVQNRWQDWSFASGQPAYDAKVGVAGRFNPLVAVGNDAVYFPSIAPGQERRLSSFTLRSSSAGGGGTAMLVDVLGIYPLIDGDSTDTQSFDNNLPLPRYADGAGVIPVLVSSVAPSVQDGIATMTYIDHAGVEQTSPVFRFQNTFTAGLVSGIPDNQSAGEGALSMPLGAASRGARAVTSLTYTQPPGGLAAIYMLRVLETAVFNANQFLALEKQCLQHHAMHCPQVLDGAYLNIFYRYGGNASTDLFGDLTFVWN